MESPKVALSPIAQRSRPNSGTEPIYSLLRVFCGLEDEEAEEEKTAEDSY